MVGVGGIRTPDILLPKQARYQTALHPEHGSIGPARREVYRHCEYWAMRNESAFLADPSLKESRPFYEG